jgi:hypothetical protein
LSKLQSSITEKQNRNGQGKGGQKKEKKKKMKIAPWKQHFELRPLLSSSPSSHELLRYRDFHHDLRKLSVSATDEEQSSFKPSSSKPYFLNGALSILRP